jgi:uncharacterized protein
MAGETAQAGKPARKARRPQRPRRVPQRTCAACRQVRPKRELLRIVRTPEGHIELDPKGKKPGRGTYLCARRSCWDLALSKGRLEHELGAPLLPEDRAALEAYRDTLPPEPEAAPAAPARRKKAGPAPNTAGAGA